MTVARALQATLAVALPVLLLWRCARSTEPPATSHAASTPSYQTPLNPSPDAPPPPVTAPAAVVPTRAPSAGTSPPSEPALDGEAATPSPTPAPSGARIVGAVARSDPRDLSLLRRIERELRRDPPPAVHELIGLRQSGASRESLLARARQLPEGDLALRVLVLRWIDEVAPAAGARDVAPAGPVGSGTAPSPVRPIERVP